MSELVAGSIQHPTGSWYFACSECGLERVSHNPIFEVPELDEHPLVEQHAAALLDMLNGEVEEYAMPVVMEGTAFQKQVWKAIAAIGFGETKSYADVARDLGGNAVRAVGTACGANPLPIAVPCHRVIRSDGGLGGFGFSGVEKKEKLLSFEKRRSKKLAA